jgi:DNA polymerase-3 subunit alpha
VKNVGVAAIDALVAAREEQPDGRFASLEAICTAVDSKVLNKRVLESLIKAGALDDLGERKELLDTLESALAAGQQAQRARDAGQISLFGMLELPPAAPVARPALASGPADELPRKVMLAWEKEATGLYFSEHPLSLVTIGPDVTPLGDISPELEGRKVTVVAMIASVRRIITKKNTTMGVMALEDMSGALELVAFPECFERHASLWTEDNIIKATVKVELRNDAVQLVCESAENFVQVERAADRDQLPVLHLTLTPSGDFWRDTNQLTEVDQLLRAFDGDEPLVLHVVDGSGARTFQAQGRGVNFCPELAAGLTKLLGQAAMRVEQPAPAEDIYEALTAD